jgi:hypothetical protein
MKKDIKGCIFGDHHLQNLIKKFGINVYKNLTKGTKSTLLNSVYEGGKFRLGTPSDQWFEKNIEDLEELKSRFPNLTNKIEPEILKCREKKFYGIIESDGEYFTWSILNKIDTNYINWAKFISERVENGDIGEISDAERIISRYFSTRDINELNIDSELFDKIEKSNISRISYAELDILEAFFKHINKKRSPKFETMLSTIKSTSLQGDDVEINFIEYLKKLGSEFVKDIKSFTTPGNLVDMGFAIDMVVNLFGKDFAVQVKSIEKHAQNSKIKKLPIDYLIIYPKKIDSKYEFNFISKKQTTPAYFNEKMEQHMLKFKKTNTS